MRRLVAVMGMVLLVLLVFARPLLRQWRYHDADRALAERDFARAIQVLQASAASHPADADTHFRLARAYRNQGEFDRVREHLLKARKLGFDVDRLQREQWLTLAQAGQLSEAEPHLQELLLDPRGDGREICEAFVNGFSINLRIQAAHLLLDTWQAEFPRDAEPYFRRGYLQQSLRDFESAVESLRRGLELAPQRWDVRLRLAQALLDLNAVGEAEEQFRQVEAELPRDDDVTIGLARCLKRRGETGEARRRLEEVAARSPENLEARLELGLLARIEGHHEEAVTWLTPVHEARPYDAQTVLTLAQAHQSLGHEQWARELFDAFQSADEREARLEGLIDEALQSPDVAETRYEIGELLAEMNSHDDAARWLRSALQLEPEHRGAHRVLATCYRALGDEKLARHHEEVSNR